MATGYVHFAGLKSANIITVGPTSASDVVNYTSLSDAFDNMIPGGHMIIYPGTYSLSATKTINYPCTIEGIGDVTVNGGTAGVATALIAVNVPPTGSTAVLIKVKNIKFSNAFSTADCVAIAQLGGSSGILTTVWDQCGFSANTGNSVNVLGNHATVTCKHYFYGARHLPFDDDMTVDLDIAASKVHVSGYQLDGGETFICGATNTAWLLELDNIVYSSDALTSGGSASLIINACNCSKIATGAHTVVGVADFDATVSSENIGLNTQAT